MSYIVLFFFYFFINADVYCMHDVQAPCRLMTQRNPHKFINKACKTAINLSCVINCYSYYSFY